MWSLCNEAKQIHPCFSFLFFFCPFCYQVIDQEMARLNYQLDNANESGQEVISHLQETAQDPSPVENKVDGINSQWNELQGKLQELRNHMIDKVS